MASFPGILESNMPKRSVEPQPPVKSGRFGGLDNEYVYKSNCHMNRIKRYLRRTVSIAVGIEEWVHINCRSWRCEVCGPLIRLPYLRERMTEEATAHGLTLWVTFTLPADHGSPQELCAHITKAFSKLTNRYKCKPGPRLSYIWVKEIKDGRPHLHVFLPPWIKRKRIKELWHRYTGGQQVHFKTIDPDTIGERVGYSTKSIIHSACKYGTSCGRWYGTSRDIHINVDRPDREGSEWELVRGAVALDGMARHDIKRGPDGRPLHFIRYTDGTSEASVVPSLTPIPDAVPGDPKAATPPQGTTKHAATGYGVGCVSEGGTA